MLITASVLLSAALASEPEFDPRANPGPWENHLIELPGRGDGGAPLTVHYLEAGPADAPAVLLLHGFPDFSYGWRHVVPLLAGDYRVIAPDLRGYAGTDAPEGGYEIDSLVDDLEALQDALLDGAPTHLLTHDWGSFIAWHAASRSPERYRSIAVIDVPHPQALAALWATSKTQRRYGRFVRQLNGRFAIRLLSGLSLERRAELFYLEELVDDGALTDDDMVRYHAIFDTRDEMRGPVSYYHHLELPDRDGGGVEPLPVQVPTLALWGAEDSYMLPELAALSCEQVDAVCEHTVFQDAGHWLQWEQADAVVERWRTFVDDHAPEPDPAPAPEPEMEPSEPGSP